MTHHTPRPREGPERCAVRAQFRGDPLLGTAFPAARLLLVEQPGPWGHGGLRDSHFDHGVARQLEQRAGPRGIRVQAIRRPGRTPRGEARRWAAVDTRPGREGVRWGRYDRDDELLAVLDSVDAAGATAGATGAADTEPVFLVCAHSRHDACCALRGRNVAASLHAVRPGRVWETTHLGGDRFAANVLVLPLGLLYGRLLPFAAAEFVHAAEAGEVVPALLRGRVGMRPSVQAALTYAYEHLAVRRSADIQVLGVSTVTGGAVTVRLATPSGAVEVHLQAERVGVPGLTCADPGPGSYLWYRLLGIDLVADAAAD